MQIDPANWETQRADLKRRVLEILGPFPEEKPDLDARVVDEVDCGTYVRRKVLYQSQPGEDIPAYLMLPKETDGPRPAIFATHPTTSGSGKDIVAGITGWEPGSEPEPACSYAHELAQRGYVVLAPDFLTDGERVYPGWEPYHSRPFYDANPEWSAVGKNIWDAMAGIDFLHTVPEADVTRLATIGFSFGGHHSMFIPAFDDRVTCAVCNGGLVSWRLPEKLGWARPLDSWYTYINKLRPYLEDENSQLPFHFYEVMSLVAPRPMLTMHAEGDGQPEEEVRAACAGARIAWQDLGVPERLGTYWYGGPHDFPPPVRDMGYAWIHHWLGHPGHEV